MVILVILRSICFEPTVKIANEWFLKHILSFCQILIDVKRCAGRHVTVQSKREFLNVIVWTNGEIKKGALTQWNAKITLYMCSDKNVKTTAALSNEETPMFTYVGGSIGKVYEV